MNLIDTELVLRLVLAAVLGSLIGLERERLSWAAGLRTHMLVSVGAALVMIVSAYGFGDVLGRPHVVLDPSRVAAQVVSGIGFLGAGTILMRQERIRGLTTAASLWAVAAIGLATGGGLYVAAVSATLLLLLILAGIRPLEMRLHRYARVGMRLDLTLDPAAGISLLQIDDALRGVGLNQLQVDQNVDEGTQRIRIQLEPAPQRTVITAADRIRAITGIESVQVTVEGAGAPH